MKNKKLEKILIILGIAFITGAFLFVFGRNLLNSVGNSSKIRNDDTTKMPEADGISNEIRKTTVVSQDFINSTDTISKVGIVFNVAAYSEKVYLQIDLLDGETVLASTTVLASSVPDQHRTYVEPAKTLTGMKNKKLTLKMYPTTKDDTGLKIMINTKANSVYTFGTREYNGTLCFSVTE